jgi:hypothetical protein
LISPPKICIKIGLSEIHYVNLKDIYLIDLGKLGRVEGEMDGGQRNILRGEETRSKAKLKSSLRPKATYLNTTLKFLRLGEMHGPKTFFYSGKG